ncbi:calcium permeable stress-gated cation channel 1 isoform X1 [Symphalangus syndactylus]|uniref:calcium permeable stress-gated cation channel 1 isoform X1 n=1 Tax=Symphalangus syndactylus TaxID=9590 RepID=UPI0024423A0C|nr:calcium permeable stress-gated cation channel 1 isoform X1 [Symphalangus syndactylus]XP_055144639.1 calcium permeable stress-gated cation channel 1 isoform X1 [Symphalangus syndactylus]XP_055144640.1 calcium permeable stress-gated cation channel 1 isoform X1 [Symphalangus syndactylus]XP_055144641.1 calcium permeable stress-gated cation channel 1 isoform X1 [Symphalangus syndactylus]XP_055144642.1 calcium permeable stress-gated cation channel 1 isoform X1 [Symphalangus syndactylus]
MSASPDDLSTGGRLQNMTVDECFQSRNTVLQGQPFGGVPTVLCLNIALWVLVLVVYSFLRKAAWDYGRLALLIHNDSLTSLIYGEQSEKTSPSETSLEMERRDKGFCSWFFNSITMKDEDLINKCGDDARIYIVFQYHLIIFVLIICIPSLGIILPINYTGSVLDWSSHFARTTIVNVSTESKLLWLHSLLSFFYFITNFMFMAHHCLGFAPRNSQKVTRTLMITYVPKDIEDPELIIKHFHEAYPGSVVTRVHFCYDVRNLIDLDDQRRHAMRGRLFYTAKAKKTGKVMIRIHPCARLCFCKCWTCFKEVDAEQYYSELEEQLTDEFNAELNRVPLKRLDLIFVTFQDSRMAKRVRKDYKYVQCGVQPQQSSVTTIVKSYYWRVTMAPHPKDIIWKHLSVRRFFWWARFIAINTFLFFLFFFLTTPAIIMNTIDMYNVTRPIEKLQSPIVTQFFPSVMLWGFTVILPLIVYFSAFLEAHWTRSSQNLVMVHKCYIFLVFMVVILPSMGLTSLDVFLRWLFDIYYLEQASIRFQCVFLPDNGAFFVNYVITAALLGTGMELLRLGSLFCYSTRLFFSRSEPERVNIRKNQAIDFQFGREYVWMMNVFSVVMAYSITCPIIVPFGLLYLCMKHLTDRYNMYYSFAPTKLNEQIHMAAVSQAIFAPLLGLFWMLFFSILRLGSLHAITIFSLSTLVIAMMIAFVGIFLGKLRMVADYEPEEEEIQTVFDMEPSSTSSTPTSLQLYVATVLQEPELNLTPASSPARHTYGTMNNQPEEGEEESGLRGFARELDSAQFQEGLELEGQNQYH